MKQNVIRETMGWPEATPFPLVSRPFSLATTSVDVEAEIEFQKQKLDLLNLEKGEIEQILELARLATVLPHPAWMQRQTPRLREIIHTYGYSEQFQPTNLPDIPNLFLEIECPIFTLTPDLLNTLRRSDIADEITCAHLKCPVPTGCYFHFSFDEQGMQGFYILKKEDGVDIAIIYRGRNDIQISIPSSDAPLKSWVEHMYAVDGCVEDICFCAAALFYCACAKHRREFIDDYSRAIKEASAKKNGRKKSAKMKAAKSKYDYILIRPEESVKGESTGRLERSAHFRRGHFRLQKWGPRWSMQKMVFIQPCFVGGSAQIKNYMVD